MNEEEPMTYEQQEELKSKSWNIILSDAPIYKKAFAVLRICEAHYWRSRENFDKQNKLFKRKVLGKHYFSGIFNTLEIDNYTKNWLWSNQHNFEKEIIEQIEKQFGYKPLRNKYMAKGYTHYCEIINKDELKKYH